MICQWRVAAEKSCHTQLRRVVTLTACGSEYWIIMFWRAFNFTRQHLHESLLIDIVFATLCQYRILVNIDLLRTSNRYWSDKYILLPKIYFIVKTIQPRYETDNTLFCENKDVKNCDANYRKRLLFTRWVNMKECETLKYFLKKQVNLTSKQTWKHFV